MVNLSWTASTDAYVTGYRIDRATSPAGTQGSLCSGQGTIRAQVQLVEVRAADLRRHNGITGHVQGVGVPGKHVR